MIFLVLYDERGQCQRVAQTNNQATANQFLNAGFIEVTEAEYQRCAELAQAAQPADLENILQARRVLQLARQTGTSTQVRTEPDLEALERLQANQRGKLQGITRDYLNGQTTLDLWDRRFLNQINSGNIAATILAKGSASNLTQEDLTQIERDNEIQIGYMKRFRRVLPNFSEELALSRSALYTGATTSRYWTAHTRQMGLPLLPAIPGVRTKCGSNCKCNWQIIPLDGDGNWNCYWRLSAVESCPTCLMRQRIFDPLEIRNGVIQPFNPNGIYA